MLTKAFDTIYHTFSGPPSFTYLSVSLSCVCSLVFELTIPLFAGVGSPGIPAHHSNAPGSDFCCLFLSWGKTIQHLIVELTAVVHSVSHFLTIYDHNLNVSYFSSVQMTCCKREAGVNGIVGIVVCGPELASKEDSCFWTSFAVNTV